VVAWGEAKQEPARMASWLALLAGAPADAIAPEDGLVRAHRRRRRETARLVRSGYS
jgi:hypothetical protein